MEPQFIPLPGRSWERKRSCELASGFGGIEAKEIDCLAHFEHRVDQRLSRFANAKREELFRMLLVEVSRAFEQPRAGLAAERVPPNLRRVARANHPVDFGGAGFVHCADLDAPIVRRGNRPRLALAEGRLRAPATVLERLETTQ